jgi:hypothetical protein
MHHPVHKTLKAAYSFYNVSTATNWVDLMSDALVSAKNVSTELLGIRRLHIVGTNTDMSSLFGVNFVLGLLHLVVICDIASFP